MLVEGAGGLLVPLSSCLNMHDMAVALDLPVLVVARNVLGVINHTALTVSVARERSQECGVVLNHTEPPDLLDIAVQTNWEALRRWGQGTHYCLLPYVATLNTEWLSILGKLLLTSRLLEGIGL